MSAMRNAGLAAITTCMVACTSVRGNSGIDGRWTGELRLGRARQPVILDVSAAQGAFVTIPALLRSDTAFITVTGDTVALRLDSESGERVAMRGIRRGDTLHLSAQGEAITEGVPQLFAVRTGTVPPPAYREISVTVPGERSLPGTLVVPATEGPHPAVVLLHGSGPGPREGLVPLARHFAAHGVAALVYDKRQIVLIETQDLTNSDDLASDAVAAVNLLAARNDIRRDRIGLWGGSQGSGVAARVAVRSPSVAFVVSVSGGGTPYTPFVLYQLTHRMRARGLDDSAIARGRSIVSQRHAFLRGTGDSASLASLMERSRSQLSGRGVLLNVPGSAERDAWRVNGFFRDDASTIWRSVRQPVLAMWGGRDILVPPHSSARAVAAALASRGTTPGIACVIPNADHGMFLPVGPGAGADGGFAFPAHAPMHVEGMIAWVRIQTELASRSEASSFTPERWNCLPPGNASEIDDQETRTGTAPSR